MIDDTAGLLGEMDDDQLAQLMSSGPTVGQNKRPLPPQPKVQGKSNKRISMPVFTPPPVEEEESEETDVPVVNEEPKEEEDMLADLKAKVILPSEEEKNLLKQRYRSGLTVVPMLSQREDGLIEGFIVRPLSRAQWRKAQEYTSEMNGKTKKSAEDLFMEKIVTMSVVWPEIQPATLEVKPAGFVPTIYGVVEKISWFFDVNTLMNITFAL